MSPDIELALATFQRAWKAVTQSPVSAEIAWQRTVLPEHFTETDLLREAAWVILCGGFREATVRRVFDHVSLCFFDWSSAAEITEVAASCITAACAVFNNRRKLSAIVNVARRIERVGFAELKHRIIGEPVIELRHFPYIGDVTVWHLAKNLGFDVAKPDRHLIRLARRHGFGDAHALCSALSHATGEPVRVVDLVLWRYAAGWPEDRRQSSPETASVAQTDSQARTELPEMDRVARKKRRL